VGHDDARADLEHRQVAAAERRAGIGRRDQRAHPCHERLGGLRCRLRVARVLRLVDRRDELGQRPQPRQAVALRCDLQKLGAGETAAVALQVDALGLEQPAMQIEQVRTQCGENVGDARSVTVLTRSARSSAR